MAGIISMFSCERINRSGEGNFLGTFADKKLNLGTKILLVAVPLIIILFLGYTLAAAHISAQLSTENFYDGTIVGGVDVSGKSRAEAIDVIYEKLKNDEQNVNLTVCCEDKSLTLTGQDFTYEYNVEDAVNSAYSCARIGNLFSRYFELLSIKNNAEKFSVKTTLEPESLGRTVDFVVCKFDDPDLEAHVKSFDPTREPMFVYSEGKDGYKLNRDEVLQQIQTSALAKKSGEVCLQKHEYKNDTTIDDAKAQTQLIGEFKTISTNNNNSNQNMKLSLEAVNGTVLRPFETFSFNQTVGDSNDPARGFLPGASILNGSIVMSYGGGICQAATTIYGAAIRADMTIIERKNHRFKSSYVPYGLDATIDYKTIDLKFRNDFTHPVYIQTTMIGKELVCRIFGPKSQNFDTIEVNSWVTAQESQEIKAEAERIYYKGDKIIDKKRLPNSVYKPKQLAA